MKTLDEKYTKNKLHLQAIVAYIRSTVYIEISLHDNKNDNGRFIGFTTLKRGAFR